MNILQATFHLNCLFISFYSDVSAILKHSTKPEEKKEIKVLFPMGESSPSYGNLHPSLSGELGYDECNDADTIDDNDWNPYSLDS